MFQFTGTYLINTNLDSSGKPKWTSQAEDLTQTPTVTGSFNVKRVGKFIKDDVIAVYKRVASNPTLATITFTITNDGVGLYRIALYIRYDGNRNSFYANDMVFQGKPFWIEYKITDATETASDIAARIVRNARLYKQMFDGQVFDISASGAVITITAMDEYERFLKADIEKYQVVDPNCSCSDSCACNFVTLKSARLATDPLYDNVNTIVQGKVGFGTYSNIIYDLRLPTMEAVRFAGINQEELPIPGALYNQYTIKYCKNRGVLGADAVGQVVKSLTTHVFYVNQNVATEFEAALANIGTIETI